MKIVLIFVLVAVTICGIFKKKQKDKEEDPVGIVLK